MDIELFLQQLGLTKNEAKTYLALLELGSVPAGPLIKKLGMHRAAVYNLLDILINKGLIHYVIQANRKYFEAQPPQRLFELIETKKEELEQQKKQLKQFLPELKIRRELSKESQEGTIYKGKRGLKSIFEDILNHKTDFLVMGGTGKFKDLFHAYYTHWQKKRAQKKIWLKIIYSESVRKEKRETELRVCKIKYLSKSYITPSTTFIYGDNVALILWSPEPMAFLMRSKQVADSYRTFFDLLWNIAKE